MLKVTCLASGLKQCLSSKHKEEKKKQRKEEGDCIFRITLSRQQYVAGGKPEGFACVSKLRVIKINGDVEKH